MTAETRSPRAESVRARRIGKQIGLMRRGSIEYPLVMRVIADFSLVPLGVGVSVSEYVAECQKILGAAGLEPRLHAYGTNIEGDWDEVFAAIRACHEAVHAMGAPRITSTLRFGTRTDRRQSAADKVESVRDKLGAGR